MKILVLGGAGYIGSHTVYELIDRGYDVVVADNLQTGHIEAVHEKAKFYEGDIRDKEFLDNLFKTEKIDCVIHFAANSLVGESMTNPLKYYDNNLCGTKVLLEATVENNINKIVFSSTAAVYGKPESIPMLEDDRTSPLNTYGETKLSMEKMFRWVDVAHNIKYVSLRYFNACGAHISSKIGEAHSPETHLIPNVLKALISDNEINVFGDDYATEDGTCVRDYIHVTDLANAHILAVEYLAKGNDSNIFNLGNGVGFSVKEIISASEKVTGKKAKVNIGQRRAGDPDVLIASSDKARKILGWQPQYTDINKIIESAYNWHKK